MTPTEFYDSRVRHNMVSPLGQNEVSHLYTPDVVKEADQLQRDTPEPANEPVP